MRQYLLLASILVIGVSGCKNNNQHKPKHRYFFVGYRCENNYGASSGNLFYKLDTMPSYSKLEDDVYQMYYCGTYYSREEIVITSISEFKDSVECIKFKGSPESPLPNCDTTAPRLKVGYGKIITPSTLEITDTLRQEPL